MTALPYGYSQAQVDAIVDLAPPLTDEQLVAIGAVFASLASAPTTQAKERAA